MDSELVSAMTVTGLNPLDWLLIAFIAVLSVISLFRGLVKEAMALVRLAASVLAGYFFAGDISGLFSASIEDPEVAYGLAFIAIFVATMVVGTIITSLLKGLITVAGLGPIDKVLGAIFGASKACILVLLLVTLVDMTPLKEHDVWVQSALIPEFAELAAWSKEHLGLQHIFS